MNQIIALFEENVGPPPDGASYIQIVKPFADHGSIVQFIGLDRDDAEYVVAVDHRAAQTILVGLMQDVEIVAAVEAWALTRMPKGWGLDGAAAPGLVL